MRDYNPWWTLAQGHKVLRSAGPSNRDLATIQSQMADASNTTAPLLAQAVASFSRSELRWELAIIAAAVAILSIALAAIALFCFRRRTRDLTLISPRQRRGLERPIL